MSSVVASCFVLVEASMRDRLFILQFSREAIDLMMFLGLGFWGGIKSVAVSDKKASIFLASDPTSRPGFKPS